MQNGVWDPDVLEILRPEGDYLLVAPASKLIGYAGWQWITKAGHGELIAAAKKFRARTGKALYVAEAFRSRDTQLYYIKHSPNGGNAVAQLDANGQTTSLHGLGLAVDVWSGIDAGFNSPEHVAFEAIAKPRGWINTGRNFHEPWHFEFSTANVTTPAGTGTTTPVGDEDLPLNDADKKWIADTIAAQVSEQNGKQLKGDGFQDAMTRVLPAALDKALDVVTTPYSDARGAHQTTLRDWFKDVRNKLFS
jgi:hypothetical protein